MAWRINALSKPALTQLGMDWGLCMASLVIALPTVWTITNTSIIQEPEVVAADGLQAADEPLKRTEADKRNLETI